MPMLHMLAFKLPRAPWLHSFVYANYPIEKFPLGKDNS